MANLKDIKRRIRSVRNTRQITRAMKMVAAAKLRRAQMRVVEARPYAADIARVVADLVAGTEEFDHPLLRIAAPEAPVHLVVIAADRGLCGGYNANVLRAARDAVWELEREGRDHRITAIGRKAADFVLKQGFNLEARHDFLLDAYDDQAARELAASLREKFVDGAMSELRLLYSHFVSALSQRVESELVLPLQVTAPGGSPTAAFLYDPSPADVLGDLLDRYLAIRLLNAGFEAYASEQGARMTAMENATNNATEMIGALTLSYNRVRQAAITKEIIEIASGADAVAAEG